MRIGFGLPNVGPLGTPEAVGRIAQRAEELNYDGLWVIERLLYPVQPQTPYPATPDGSLPDVYKHVLDPLETLTFAAARTKRIGLGTSVLDIPYDHFRSDLPTRSPDLGTLARADGANAPTGLSRGPGWRSERAGSRSRSNSTTQVRIRSEGGSGRSPRRVRTLFVLDGESHGARGARS